MSRIAFIGLGIMGRPMSRNLLKAGHELTVYDVVPAAVAEIAGAGAATAGSCREAAAAGDVIITMLPDGPEVETAVLGKDGVLEGARARVHPGRHELDQPDGVAEGRGGLRGERRRVPGRAGERRRAEGHRWHACHHGRRRQERSTRCSRFSQKMGSSVTLTGAVGAGNVTKLANQIMVACNIAAMGEALTLATKAGLDPEVVFNAVKGGLAGSTV